MTPDEVLIYLRKRGVTVHLVAPDVSDGLIVFLEANLGQQELAEDLLRLLPLVTDTQRKGGGILRVTRKR